MIKKILIGLAAVFVLSSCSLVDEHNSERGRGDAPVGTVDDTPGDVIQFPDRFMNVAHKCDGHGHRVYVTTRPENGRSVTVIDDPSCSK